MNVTSSVSTIDTEAFAPAERMAFLIDGLRDTVGRFDVTLLSGAPMRQVFTVREVAATGIVSFHSSAVQVSRRADEHADDGYLSFNLMRTGEVLRHSQFGRSVEVRPGQAFLNALYEPFVCGSPADHGFDMLRLSRRQLALRLADVEGAVAAPLAQGPALNLLSVYMTTLKTHPGLIGPDLLGLAESHIHDLVALALNPGDRRGRHAGRDGAKAARKLAIKRYVAAQLTDPTLSSEGVAGRFAMSDRYLRMLFEDEGGFWSYVIAERLDQAARMLRDPAFSGVKVIEVAYRCGFNSVSAFNRDFAKTYGCAPSSMR